MYQGGAQIYLYKQKYWKPEIKSFQVKRNHLFPTFQWKICNTLITKKNCVLVTFKQNSGSMVSPLKQVAHLQVFHLSVEAKE